MLRSDLRPLIITLIKMKLNLYAVCSLLAYGAAAINLQAEVSLSAPGHDQDLSLDTPVLTEVYLDEEDRHFLVEKAS